MVESPEEVVESPPTILTPCLGEWRSNADTFATLSDMLVAGQFFTLQVLIMIFDIDFVKWDYMHFTNICLYSCFTLVSFFQCLGDRYFPCQWWKAYGGSNSAWWSTFCQMQGLDLWINSFEIYKTVHERFCIVKIVMQKSNCKCIIYCKYLIIIVHKLICLYESTT